MTIADQQRQTVRDTIKGSAFEDPIMQDFAKADGFELGDVLSRARELAEGDRQLHDTSVARDIIVLIENFKTG